MTVKLGIVIVHYNTPGDLGRCLESLHDHAPGGSHEIVVVDNASMEPGLDAVRERYPSCTWLMNTENRGYARGCNQGMAQVDAEFLLVLNPDIIVQAGALDRLVEFAVARPRAGLVGPQLLNEDGTIQESCRRFYTFKTLLLRRTFLGKLFPNSRTVQRHLMRDFDHRSERPVDWVLGGCVLVRREALVRCGPMDERFFLYFEDVDWCYRMWRSGFEVVYAPEARFIHRHRRASAKGPLSRTFWLHLGSLLSFYEKWGLLVYMLKKWRDPIELVSFWLLDMGLLQISFLTAYGIRWLLQPLFTEALLPLGWYRGFALSAAVMVTVAFILLRRYRTERLRRRTGLGEHLRQMGLVALLLLASTYLGRQQVVSRAVLLLALGSFGVLSAVGEAILRRLQRRFARGYLNLERTLLVGAPGQLQAWLASVTDLRAEGVDAVGYATPESPPAPDCPALSSSGVPWLGSTAHLTELVERFRVSQVVFWTQPTPDPAQVGELVRLRRRRIRLRWRIDETWLLAAGARAETFGRQPSGVLDPDDRLAVRHSMHRVLSFAAGILLAVSSLFPHLGMRPQTVRLDAVTDSGDRRQLTLACRPDGTVLPLLYQWSLAWSLVRGRIYLWGERLRPAGQRRPADAILTFQAASDERPGLTGPWVRSNPWRALWSDPGGFEEVAPS